MTLRHSALTDQELAGRALAHPLALLLTDRTVAVLAEIAVCPVTTQEEHHFLQQVLGAIDGMEILQSGMEVRA